MLDKGKPVEQTNGPYSGYYISKTSLTYKGKPESSPKRYVDSGTVPYLALPGKLVPASGGPMRLGDLAVVLDEKTGRVVYAIVADIGPDRWVAEGSVSLAEKLEERARSGRKAGYDMQRACAVLVFPYSGDGPEGALAPQDIERRAKAAFEAWGGIGWLMESISLLPEPTQWGACASRQAPPGPGDLAHRTPQAVSPPKSITLRGCTPKQGSLAAAQRWPRGTHDAFRGIRFRG